MVKSFDIMHKEFLHAFKAINKNYHSAKVKAFQYRLLHRAITTNIHTFLLELDNR